MKSFRITIKCNDGIHQYDIKGYHHLLNSLISEIVWGLQYNDIEVYEVESALVS